MAICARNEAGLRKTALEIESLHSVKILPILADLTKASEVKNLVDETVSRFGWVDILVTNTGSPPPGPSTYFSDQDWEYAVLQNLMSNVRLCRLVLPLMKKQRWGRVINMISVSAKQPLEDMILSNSIKAAIVGMAKTLSEEVAADNILINNVCAGWILTDRLIEMVRKSADKKGKTYDKVLAELAATIPIKRCGTAEEVANLAIFLASERAAYITGTTIQVDGGLIKGLL